MTQQLSWNCCCALKSEFHKNLVAVTNESLTVAFLKSQLTILKNFFDCMSYQYCLQDGPLTWLRMQRMGSNVTAVSDLKVLVFSEVKQRIPSERKLKVDNPFAFAKMAKHFFSMWNNQTSWWRTRWNTNKKNESFNSIKRMIAFFSFSPGSSKQLTGKSSETSN